MVLNLHSFYPVLKDLVDYVLFRPSAYKLRPTFDCNCFFETEFRGHVNLYDQARRQLEWARDGDILIAPDKLYLKNETINRITDWFSFLESRDFDGKNLTILFPTQGKNYQEMGECVNYWKENIKFTNKLYGLGIFTCINAFTEDKDRHKYTALRFIDEFKLNPLHLLGWSFTTEGYNHILSKAFSVDSQGVFPMMTKTRYFVNKQLKRIRSSCDNKATLEQRTRWTFENSIYYWKQYEKSQQNGFGGLL